MPLPVGSRRAGRRRRELRRTRKTHHDVRHGCWEPCVPSVHREARRHSAPDMSRCVFSFASRCPGRRGRGLRAWPTVRIFRVGIGAMRTKLKPCPAAGSVPLDGRVGPARSRGAGSDAAPAPAARSTTRLSTMQGKPRGCPLGLSLPGRPASAPPPDASPTLQSISSDRYG